MIIKINSEGIIKAILLELPAKKLSLEFVSSKSIDKVKSISVQSHNQNNPLLGQFPNFEHDDTLFDDLFEKGNDPKPDVVVSNEPKLSDIKYLENYHVSISAIELKFDSDSSKSINLDLPSGQHIRTEITELLPLISKHITQLVPSIDLERDMCQSNTAVTVPVSELLVSADLFPSLTDKRRSKIKVV